MSTTIVLVLIGGILFYGVSLYNALINKRNRVGNAFAQIDVQLTRRHDLIPNLVETVKGYMAHEKETLDAVISARNAAVSGLQTAKGNPTDPDAIQALAKSENSLTGSLGKLFALAEAYPDLKANTTMINLQEELSSTENKVAFSRQAFNDSVLDYNNAREVFPGNLVANGFGFSAAAFLEIESESMRATPQVKFGD